MIHRPPLFSLAIPHLFWIATILYSKWPPLNCLIHAKCKHNTYADLSLAHPSLPAALVQGVLSNVFI